MFARIYFQGSFLIFTDYIGKIKTTNLVALTMLLTVFIASNTSNRRNIKIINILAFSNSRNFLGFCFCTGLEHETLSNNEIVTSGTNF